jgi:hypothetical protein
MWPSVGLFLLLATCSPGGRADRKLLQLSLPELSLAAAGGEGLADIKRALNEVGGLAVSGLGLSAYSLALDQLRASAPACIATRLDDPGMKVVTLEDGTRRMSLVRMEEDDLSAEQVANWPPCMEAEMAAVTVAFDLVEQEMIAALGRLLGNETLLVATPPRPGSPPEVRKMADLAAKTHVHVYEAGEKRPESNSEQLSLSYHLDNGLYLLLTPSPQQPLRLRSRHGRPVRTDAVADDSVLFLLGRGLTDWLLQGVNGEEGGDDRYRHLVPALHAVPSMAETDSTRTVVARMRVAPFEAVPARAALSQRRRLSFGDIFLDGQIRPSAASLCYYGGPLNRAESQLRNRRHAADCWPHTQKC